MYEGAGCFGSHYSYVDNATGQSTTRYVAAVVTAWSLLGLPRQAWPGSIVPRSKTFTLLAVHC
jgi:hypothetical protein